MKKINKIHINKIYTMAKSMKCDEFESLVAKLIDGVPFTSVHNNKYYLVNERVILEPTTEESCQFEADNSTSATICKHCGREKYEHSKTFKLCSDRFSHFEPTESKMSFKDWYKKKYDPKGYLYPSKPIDIGFQDYCARVDEYLEQFAEHCSSNQSKGDCRKVIIDFLAWRNGSILSKDTFLEIDTFLKEIKGETK